MDGVKYNKTTGEIIIGFNRREKYAIDIDKCKTAEDALREVYQVFKKGWATREIVFALLMAFDEACWERGKQTIEERYCQEGGRQ